MKIKSIEEVAELAKNLKLEWDTLLSMYNSYEDKSSPECNHTMTLMNEVAAKLELISWLTNYEI